MKTPHELACAISALINSQPRSPTVAELEGVIQEHWQPVKLHALVITDKSEAIAELAEATARAVAAQMQIMRCSEDGVSCAPGAPFASMTGVAAHLTPKLAQVSLDQGHGHIFIKDGDIVPGPVFYGSGWAVKHFPDQACGE